MQATVTGSDCFKGNRILVVPPRSVGLYSISFKPEWLCEESAELVLDSTAFKGTGQPPMQFSLRGIGLEPLAEDHVVITCEARDRVEHGFIVKNPCKCALAARSHPSCLRLCFCGSCHSPALPLFIPLFSSL